MVASPLQIPHQLLIAAIKFHSEHLLLLLLPLLPFLLLQLLLLLLLLLIEFNLLELY
jgi:hypothetical protein